MSYQSYYLKPSLEIKNIYTVHYFEYSSSYAFAGESHDFWEFLYVDKGSLKITAGDSRYELSRGQIIFHPPGQFHALSSNGVSSPSLVVVSFRCDSPAMDFFRSYTGFLDARGRSLLARIIRESRDIFSTRLDDPRTSYMERREHVPFGSEQLLAAAIEELLIRLIRQGSVPTLQSPDAQDGDGKCSMIVDYMEQRLEQPLTLAQICRDNLTGRAQLERIFHEELGCGVIDYFTRLKIRAARRMIREGQLNFTQISARLGFSSLHYFSRCFKKISGMSPSEYAKSVKMLLEDPE